MFNFRCMSGIMEARYLQIGKIYDKLYSMENKNDNPESISYIHRLTN